MKERVKSVKKFLAFSLVVAMVANILPGLGPISAFALKNTSDVTKNSIAYTFETNTVGTKPTSAIGSTAIPDGNGAATGASVAYPNRWGHYSYIDSEAVNGVTNKFFRYYNSANYADTSSFYNGGGVMFGSYPNTTGSVNPVVFEAKVKYVSGMPNLSLINLSSTSPASSATRNNQVIAAFYFQTDNTVKYFVNGGTATAIPNVTLDSSSWYKYYIYYHASNKVYFQINSIDKVTGDETMIGSSPVITTGVPTTAPAAFGINKLQKTATADEMCLDDVYFYELGASSQTKLDIKTSVEKISKAQGETGGAMCSLGAPLHNGTDKLVLNNIAPETIVPKWSIVGTPKGVTIDSDGLLTVGTEAISGIVTVQADADGYTSATKNIEIEVLANAVASSVTVTGSERIKYSTNVGGNSSFQAHVWTGLNGTGGELTSQVVTWDVLDADNGNQSIANDENKVILSPSGIGNQVLNLTVMPTIGTSKIIVKATVSSNGVSGQSSNIDVYRQEPTSVVFTTQKESSYETINLSPLTKQYSSIVKDQDGEDIANSTIVWSVDNNPTGVTIDTNGNLNVDTTATTLTPIVRATVQGNSISAVRPFIMSRTFEEISYPDTAHIKMDIMIPTKTSTTKRILLTNSNLTNTSNRLMDIQINNDISIGGKIISSDQWIEGNTYTFDIKLKPSNKANIADDPTFISGKADVLVTGIFAGSSEIATKEFKDLSIGYAGVGDDSSKFANFVWINAGNVWDSKNTLNADIKDMIMINNMSVTREPSENDVIISTLKERQIIQRNDENKANVNVAGVYYTTDNVDSVEICATLMSDALGGENVDWKNVSTFGDGKYNGELQLQAGGWYEIKVRVKIGETYITKQVQKIGVGDIFLTAGQSNSASFGQDKTTPKYDTISTWNPNNNTWVFSADSQVSWNGSFVGSGGSPWPTLGDYLAEKNNVPIGFISSGWGSSVVSDFLPENARYTRLKIPLQYFGKNGIKAVLWHQGESDAIAGTSSQKYTETLLKVIEQSRIDAGYDIPWVIATASYHTSASATVENQNKVVAGQIAACNEVNIFRGPNTDDMLAGFRSTADGVHFRLAGLIEHGIRWGSVLSQKVYHGSDKFYIGNTNVIAKDNSYDVSFKVNNKSENKLSFATYVALYNNDILVSIKKVDVNDLDKNNFADINVTFDNIDATQKYQSKVFIWSNNEQKPYIRLINII